MFPHAKEIVGIRGTGVMQLASLGAPVLPGFLMPNETVKELIAKPQDAKKFFLEPISKMERVLGKRYNDEKNPMLIKVVESPVLTMIGAFSIHNVGLCDKTVGGFGTFVGEEFAYHEYRNVLRKLVELEGKTEIDEGRRKKIGAFADGLKASKKQTKVKAVIEEYKGLYPKEIFENAYTQLEFVVGLFHSFFKINASNIDSALLLQAMTFGNYGEESYYGNFYTRDIISGESEISGKYFLNAFDATQAAGKPVTQIESNFPQRAQEGRRGARAALQGDTPGAVHGGKRASLGHRPDPRPEQIDPGGDKNASRPPRQEDRRRRLRDQRDQTREGSRSSSTRSSISRRPKSSRRSRAASRARSAPRSGARTFLDRKAAQGLQEGHPVRTTTPSSSWSCRRPSPRT